MIFFLVVLGTYSADPPFYMQISLEHGNQDSTNDILFIIIYKTIPFQHG